MNFKIFFTLTVFLSLSLQAYAQTTSDRPLITVTGQAEIMTVPDEVVFNLNATTVDKDLLTAQRKTDAVVKNVLALAAKYQIPANHVQTGHIVLEERFSNEAATRQPSVFLGYAVIKNISITLRDVSKVEALLSEIFRTGITRISSVDFRSTQSRKLRDQARLMAIKAAQEKAGALAREIGQSIGKAHTIVEQGLDARRFNSNVTLDSYIGDISEEPSPIALGQISITARVLVSFELK